MRHINKVKIIILGLIVGFGISVVFAWTDPTEAPPGGNVPAPLNVGSTEQTKSGPLNINNSFWANFVGIDGNGYVDGRLVYNNQGGGVPATGKVLVSEDEDGTANWTDAPVFSCTQRTHTTTGVKTASVSCLPGETLTGGGGTCLTSFMTANTLSGSDTWQISCNQDTTVTTYAICCGLEW